MKKFALLCVILSLICGCSTKKFYSTYKQRLDLLSNSPFNDDTTQCVWNYNLSKEN